MATSLHDLLDELTRVATDPRGALRCDDAIAALAPAALALTRLADDGLDREVGGRRELVVRNLASASTRAAAAWPATPDLHAIDLMGATADMVGLLRFEFTRPGRWPPQSRSATLPASSCAPPSNTNPGRGSRSWSASGAAPRSSLNSPPVPRPPQAKPSSSTASYPS
jgi:hypothetical protein